MRPRPYPIPSPRPGEHDPCWDPFDCFENAYTRLTRDLPPERAADAAHLHAAFVQIGRELMATRAQVPGPHLDEL